MAQHLLALMSSPDQVPTTIAVTAHRKSEVNIPPPHLRAHADLDGLHIVLAGRVPPRDISFLNLSLVGIALFIGMYLAPIVSFAMAVVGFCAWFFSSVPGSYQTKITLSGLALTINNDSIRYDQILSATPHGSTTAPQVLLSLADASGKAIGLENEPWEHAEWLANVLTERGRAARAQLRGSDKVPRSLQSLRGPSTQ